MVTFGPPSSSSSSTRSVYATPLSGSPTMFHPTFGPLLPERDATSAGQGTTDTYRQTTRNSLSAVRIPLFSGGGNDDVEEWLFTVRLYFSAVNPEPSRYVSIASSCLEGRARTWWRAEVLALDTPESVAAGTLTLPNWTEFQ